MKIFFAIASYAGLRRPEAAPFSKSLLETMQLCMERGHEPVLSLNEGSCYIQFARNELAQQFMDGDCDAFFSLDDDVEWNAEDALRLIEMPDEMVAGVYPKKSWALEQYPVVLRTDANDRPIVRADGCIAATLLPTGFLRIKRSVFEKMQAAYENRKYKKLDTGETLYDLFAQGLHDGMMWGEDFAFCKLWNDILGMSWVVPDIELRHHGKDKDGKPKVYIGNFHQFLLRQPHGILGPDVEVYKADEIRGFMGYDELIWLAEQAKSHSTIVEIGSFYGRSTRALADNTNGVVYAVDDWEGPREAPVKLRLDVEETFRNNLKDLIEAGRVIPHTADHAGDYLADVFPDMVFIDADHSYEGVKRDIQYWLSRVKPGGLICGHDIDMDEVRKAVNELLPESQTAPRTNIWYYQLQGENRWQSDSITQEPLMAAPSRT